MGHSAGRIAEGAADRRAPGFGAEWRLARRRLNVMAALEILRRIDEEFGAAGGDSASGGLGG